MKSIEYYNTYVLKSRHTLEETLEVESNNYNSYLYKNLKEYILGKIKSEHVIKIKYWQKISRFADFYDYRYHVKGGIINLISYLWYIRKRNILGRTLGLEISTEHIGKGLLIYHYNNVVNPSAIIGENLHLHGCNVIGNAGNGDFRCPVIGNNVMMGAGAKVIGGVTIADNIKIAAGAVVVNSFTEPGITIGGIPARRLK